MGWGFGGMGLDANPGKPTWGPHLDINAALKHETKLTRADPLGALAWDRRADARRAYWEASVFAPAFDAAFIIKYNYPTSEKEDPDVVIV